MGKFSVVVLLMICWMYLHGDVRGIAFPHDNKEDEEAAQISKTSRRDEDEITQLRDQVVTLQHAVAELTRSFSSLELIAKSPSLVEKLLAFDDPDTSRDSPKLRVERDVNSESPPTTSSPSLSDDQHSHSSPVGPPMWPMPGQYFMCPPCGPGPRGPPGLQGPMGPQGLMGPQGIAGRDGRDGRDAPIQSQEEISIVQPSPTETPAVQTNPAVPSGGTTSPSNGAVYIRWGNKVCPAGAELIYKGTVGGSYYTHSGGGSNYLYMPDTPIYNETKSSGSSLRALLYSSEYAVSTAPSRIANRHDHTPTCAVCKAPSGRTTKLMIPARNVCPSSEWRLEYAGYLMAEYQNHKRTEFGCFDKELDYEPGTQGNENGALFYMVEGKCLAGGGLHCGPYVDGDELTCAVCTM